MTFLADQQRQGMTGVQPAEGAGGRVELCELAGDEAPAAELALDDGVRVGGSRGSESLASRPLR